MKTLTDFLKEQAEQQQSQAGQREAKRVEWVQSVERLIRQLQEWLHEADTPGVLRVTVQPHTVREQSIGGYEAPSLTIGLGSREVRVLPVARDVVGSIGDPGFRAQGLVDLTDSAFKYLLYRRLDDRGERWVIVDDRDYSVQPLDRTTFEGALLSLLA